MLLMYVPVTVLICLVSSLDTAASCAASAANCEFFSTSLEASDNPLIAGDHLNRFHRYELSVHRWFPCGLLECQYLGIKIWVLEFHVFNHLLQANDEQVDVFGDVSLSRHLPFSASLWVRVAITLKGREQSYRNDTIGR